MYGFEDTNNGSASNSSNTCGGSRNSENKENIDANVPEQSRSCNKIMVESTEVAKKQLVSESNHPNSLQTCASNNPSIPLNSTEAIHRDMIQSIEQQKENAPNVENKFPENNSSTGSSSIDSSQSCTLNNSSISRSSTVGMIQNNEQQKGIASNDTTIQNKSNVIGSQHENSSDSFDHVDLNEASTSNASSSVKPARRLIRSKSVNVTRNHVYLEENPPDSIDEYAPVRRSQRIPKPLHHLNYGLVKCCICKKSFHQDISIGHYAGDIVCSFECMRKPN